MSNSCRYSKGDVIFVSKPFVHVLDNCRRGQLCDYCFKRNSILKRCSKCRFVFYCNEQCQKSSWQIHKYECQRLKRCFPQLPSNSLRFLANIIFMLEVKKNAYEEIGGYQRTFDDLESHSEEIKNDAKRMQQFQTILVALENFMGQKYNPNEIFIIFGKMVINSFSILDNEMQAIGSGLFLGPSILDHSCEPNAVVTFDRIFLYLQAVKDLPTKNIKDVFISYIDQLEIQETKQQQLQEQYYFTCNCSRCIGDYWNKETLRYPLSKENCNDIVEKSKNMLEILKKMKRNNDDPKDILKLALPLLKKQESVMYPINVLLVKIQDIIFDAYINICKWEEALSIGIKTLDAYKYYYSDYHPCLGIQLFRIGKIQLYLEKIKEADNTLKKAEEILKITHGVNHPLYQELFQLIVQCQQELYLSSE